MDDDLLDLDDLRRYELNEYDVIQRKGLHPEEGFGRNVGTEQYLLTIRIELYLHPKYRSNLKGGRCLLNIPLSKIVLYGGSPDFSLDMKREEHDSPILTLTIPEWDCLFPRRSRHFRHFKFVLSILQENQIHTKESKEYELYGTAGTVQRLIFIDEDVENNPSGIYADGCEYFLKKFIRTCAIQHCAKEMLIFIDRYRDIIQGNMKELLQCLTNDFPGNSQERQKLIILLASLPSPNIHLIKPLCAWKLLEVLSKLNRTDPICLSSQQIVRISEYLLLSYHMNNHKKVFLFDTMKYIYPNLVSNEEFIDEINIHGDYGLVPNDIKEDDIEPRYGGLLKSIVSNTPEINPHVDMLLTNIVLNLPHQLLQNVANLFDESVKTFAKIIIMDERGNFFNRFLFHYPERAMRVWKSLIPEKKKRLRHVFFKNLCESMPKAIDADEQLVRDICLEKDNLSDKKIARSIVSACAKSPSGVFIPVLAEALTSKLFSSGELDSLSKEWFSETLSKLQKEEFGYKQLRDLYSYLRSILEMVNSRCVRIEMEDKSKDLMNKYGIDKLMNSEILVEDCLDQQKADDNTLFLKHLSSCLRHDHAIRNHISKKSLRLWWNFHLEKNNVCEDVSEALLILTEVAQNDSNEVALLKATEWKLFWETVLETETKSGSSLESYASRKVLKSLNEFPERLERFEYTYYLYNELNLEKIKVLNDLIRKQGTINYDISENLNIGRRHAESVMADLMLSKTVLLRIIYRISDDKMRSAAEALLTHIKKMKTFLTDGKEYIRYFLESTFLYGDADGIVSLIKKLHFITQSGIYWNSLRPIHESHLYQDVNEKSSQLEIGIYLLKILCDSEKEYIKAWENICHFEDNIAKEGETMTKSCTTEHELRIAMKSGVVNLPKIFDEYDIKNLLDLLDIYFRRNRIASPAESEMHNSKGEINEQTSFTLSTDLQLILQILKCFDQDSILLIQVLLDGEDVLKFLQRSSSDDLRNLNDAVKDDTDQNVSVVTMSNLLNVDQQLRPVVFFNFNHGPLEFFRLLQCISKSEEIEVFLKCFKDCKCQIHSLESFYDKMTRSADTTSATIRNILSTGWANIVQDDTDFDFKIIFSSSECIPLERELSSSDASDLRSKSLLITSTNEELTADHDQFLAFINVMDSICCIVDLFNEMRISGYYDQEQFLGKLPFEDIDKKLENLTSKYITWQHSVKRHREKGTILHYLSHAQLKQVYDFIWTKQGKQNVRAILDYIEPKVNHIVKPAMLPTSSEDTMKSKDDEVLDDISTFLHKQLTPVEDVTLYSDGANQLEIWKFSAESVSVLHAVIKIFHDSSSPIFAKDILFCEKDIGKDEVSVFIQRRTETNISIRCICFTEFLRNEINEVLVEELQSFSMKHQGRKLVILIRGDVQNDLDKAFSEQIVDKNTTTFEDVPSILHKHYPNIRVIWSPYPGLGKSEFIKRKAHQKNLNIRHILLTGNLSKDKVISDLRDLVLNENDVLHIDIGDVYNVEIVDSLVFQIVILRYLSSLKCTISVPANHIYIEVANTFRERLRKKIPFTVMFRNEVLHWENFDDFRISAEMFSPAQVVCAYLQHYGDLDSRDVQLHERKFTDEECRKLLKNKCRIGDRPSFYTINTFLCVLGEQLKKLSASIFFRQENLKLMSKSRSEGIKRKLFDAIYSMAIDIAQRNIIGYNNDSENEDMLTEQSGRQIHWGDTNHMLIVFNNSNIETVSALFQGLDDVAPEIRDLFKDQLGNELVELHQLQQCELQNRIQKIIRTKDTLAEADPEYVLTADNILKMTLISQKMDSNIPIVIMGETGCGKTSLLRYLASLRDMCINVFSIHAGWSYEKMIQNIESFNEKCMNELEREFLLFLDEINTSEHVGLLCDIVLHHRIAHKTLAPNIILAAACNPYKVRSIESQTPGLKYPDEREVRGLLYNVYALPEVILEFVWDFGSLQKNDEYKYIERMVLNSLKEFEMDLKIVTALLARSQDHMRNSKQCVSLRDINRCTALTKWFQNTYLPSKGEDKISSDSFMKAVLLSICLCYHARLSTTRERQELREEIANLLKDFPLYSDEDKIQNMWTTEQTYVLNNMQIGGDVAKNKVLKENVFALFVCVINRIPICLIGEPGCSKSLSVQLLRSNLRGGDSPSAFLKKFPQTYFISFQGSESSSSDGIEDVFRIANEYQIACHKFQNATQIVVLIDEIGLAEKSQNDPLKVLHAILDPPEGNKMTVSVVGLSNWCMDPAKMNRMLHLSCSNMDFTDLYQTATAIYQNIAALEALCGEEEDLIKNLVQSHFKYTSNLFPRGFHGIRDFYGLIKFISNEKKRKASTFSKTQWDNVVKKGVARNYGGLAKENENDHAFQAFFAENSEGPELQNIIMDNLEDRFCRNLMLFVETDAVIWTIQNMLDKNKMQYEIIIGSRFDGDQGDDYHYRVLSRIIACMEQGRILILKDLDRIYGSFYDMLNQKYTKIGNSNYCRVALGAHSNPLCFISETFKCVVVTHPSFANNSKNVPFLGSFEKQNFELDDIVHNHLKKSVDEMNEILKRMQDNETYSLQMKEFHLTPIYSTRLILTLIGSMQDEEREHECLKKKCYTKLAKVLNADGVLRILNSSVEGTERMIVENIKSIYFSLPIHNGLAFFIDKEIESVSLPSETNREETDNEMKAEISTEINSSGVIEHDNQAIFASDSSLEFAACAKMNRLITVFTNSDIREEEYMNELTYSAYTSLRIKDITSEKYIISKLKKFWSDKSQTSHFLIIECDQRIDMEHLLLIKSKIESYRKQYIQKIFQQIHRPKHVILIIFKDKRKAKSAFRTCNFMSSWETFSIDSLCKPNICLTDAYSMGVSDLLRNHKTNMFDVDQLFMAFTALDYKYSEQRCIETIKKIIVTLSTQHSLLEPLISRVLHFIGHEENIGSWLANIAYDRYILSQESTVSGAIEVYLRDKVRCLLAEVLQIVDDGFMLDEIIRRRSDEDFIKTWASLTRNPEVVKLSGAVRNVMPKSLPISLTEVQIKLPFSIIFIERMDKLFEYFLESTHHYENDTKTKEERETCQTSHNMYFRAKTFVFERAKRILEPLKHSWYSDLFSDYISDFLEYSCLSQRTQTNMLHIFLWILRNDECIDDDCSELFEKDMQYEGAYDDLVLFITTLHVFIRMNHEKIVAAIHLIERSSKSKNESVNDVLKNIDTAKNKYENEGDNSALQHLVDYACKSILDSKIFSVMSLRNWQCVASETLVFASVLGVDSSPQLVLRFMNDVICMLCIPGYVDKNILVELSHLFMMENRPLHDEKAIETIIRTIFSFQNPNVSIEILLAIICRYARVCYAFDTDSFHVVSKRVLEKALSKIPTEQTLVNLSPIIRLHLSTVIDTETEDNEIMEVTMRHLDLIRDDEILKLFTEKGFSSQGHTILIDLLEEHIRSCVPDDVNIRSTMSQIMECKRIILKHDHPSIVSSYAVSYLRVYCPLTVSDVFTKGDEKHLSELFKNLSIKSDENGRIFLQFLLRCLSENYGSFGITKRIEDLSLSIPVLQDMKHRYKSACESLELMSAATFDPNTLKTFSKDINTLLEFDPFMTVCYLHVNYFMKKCTKNFEDDYARRVNLMEKIMSHTDTNKDKVIQLIACNSECRLPFMKLSSKSHPRHVLMTSVITHLMICAYFYYNTSKHMFWRSLIEQEGNVELFVKECVSKHEQAEDPVLKFFILLLKCATSCTAALEIDVTYHTDIVTDLKINESKEVLCATLTEQWKSVTNYFNITESELQRLCIIILKKISTIEVKDQSKPHEYIECVRRTMKCRYRELDQQSNEFHKAFENHIFDETLRDHQLLTPFSYPSFDNALTEILLDNKETEYPLLTLILRRRNKLRLMTHLRPLLNWHHHIRQMGRFLLKKTECREMSVEQFLSKYPDSRKVFDGMKESITFITSSSVWKIFRCLNPDLRVRPVHYSQAITDLLIFDSSSQLYRVIQSIVKIQNDFLDDVQEIFKSSDCLPMSFLKGENSTVFVPTTSILLLKDIDIVPHEIKLDVGMCVLETKSVDKIIKYDYETMEKEFAIDFLHLKKYIHLKEGDLCIEFRDNMSEKWMKRLKTLSDKCPQNENLPDDVSQSLRNKLSLPRDLDNFITFHGIVITIMSEVENEPGELLTDFFEHRRQMFPPMTVQSVIPKAAKLEHAVAMYELLEEMCGDLYLEEAHKEFRVPFQDVISVTSSTKDAWGYFWRCLKIYAHRCLTNPETRESESKETLRKVMEYDTFWPVESAAEGWKKNLPKMVSTEMKVSQIFEIHYQLKTKLPEMSRREDISTSYSTQSDFKKKKMKKKIGRM